MAQRREKVKLDDLEQNNNNIKLGARMSNFKEFDAHSKPNKTSA